MSDDPFEQPEKRPAVSWKGAKDKTVVTGTVVEAPKMVQSRDFESGELAYWDKEQEQPKMSVVVGLNIDGEERSLWCAKPSSLFAAVAEAQKDAGERISEGGVLKIMLTGRKQNPDKPKLNPQNLFKAKYEPPDAFAMNSQPEAAADAGDDAGAGDEDDPPF